MIQFLVAARRDRVFVHCCCCCKLRCKLDGKEGLLGCRWVECWWVARRVWAEWRARAVVAAGRGVLRCLAGGSKTSRLSFKQIRANFWAEKPAHEVGTKSDERVVPQTV